MHAQHRYTFTPTNGLPTSHADAPQLFGNLDLIYELNKRLLADLKQAGNAVGKVRVQPRHVAHPRSRLLSTDRRCSPSSDRTSSCTPPTCYRSFASTHVLARAHKATKSPTCSLAQSRKMHAKPLNTPRRARPWIWLSNSRSLLPLGLRQASIPCPPSDPRACAAR